MSLFVTFEGGEGSGKSLQARALYRRLGRLSIPAILVHEPGCTPLGEKLSRLLKWGQATEILPMSELLLFSAARTQLVSEVIRPALKAGKLVVCDRYTDSTVAYQGYGRGLDIETVKDINETATGGLYPDLTVLLDIPVREGIARKRPSEFNRFEQETLAFHNRVRRSYLKTAGDEPGRFLVVDARLRKEKIAQIIWGAVASLMGSSKT